MSNPQKTSKSLVFRIVLYLLLGYFVAKLYMSGMLLAAIVSALGFGFLIFIHELGHFMLAKREGVEVKAFSIGFGPKIFGWKRGETEYKFSALPLGGYVNMTGLEEDEDEADPDKSFAKKSIMARFRIIVAGVVVNFLFGILALTIVNIHGVMLMKTTITPIKDLPAAEYLVKGDEVIAINGVEVTHWEELSAEIDLNGKNAPGKPMVFTIARETDNGIEHKEFSITPKKTKGTDVYGAEIDRWVVGVQSNRDLFYGPGVGFGEAVGESFKFAGKMFYMTFAVIGKLMVGTAKAENTVGGPVMIAVILAKTSQLGFFAYLDLLAKLSLVLFMMNALPIPVLDGGHILFLAIEKFRGKPLKKETQGKIQMVFIMLLISLMLLITWVDINRFIGS